MAVSQINNASLASGVPSAAKLPAGSVLQVVTQQYSATLTTVSVSSTFADTGHNISVTSKIANSKFLVSLVGGGWHDIQTQSNMFLTFQRNFNGGAYSSVTNGNGGTNEFGLARMSGDGGAFNIGPYSMAVLDEPGQAAGTVINFRVVARCTANSSQYQSNDRGIPTITVMEIAV
jgi:hypothetical protein